MDEKKNDATAENESVWDWLAGFFMDKELPAKLRGTAKAVLVLGGIFTLINVVVVMGRGLFSSAFLLLIFAAFCFLALAWLLYAVADIHEKTAENNEILRKAFPEHIPQPEKPAE